jgi:hypothetical protein
MRRAAFACVLSLRNIGGAPFMRALATVFNFEGTVSGSTTAGTPVADERPGVAVAGASRKNWD